MELDFMSEVEEREKQGIVFATKYSTLNRIPVIRQVSLFYLVHGYRNILLLAAIFLSFTLVKIPYWDVPFTGEHATKYTTYVEPAVYMAEKNNIFWYQQKYVSDPVSSPEGIHEKFNHLPLFEWGLYFVYKIFPYGNIEFKTRLFSHIIGLFILLSSYMFFSEFLKKDLSILITFLISINPVVVFSTFVTVLDSMVILFMFLSLLFLSKHVKNKNIDSLFIAGVLFGIGTSIKLSFPLWMIPISILIIYFCKINNSEFLYNITVYATVAIIVLIALITSIYIIPSSPIKGMLLFCSYIVLFICLRYGLKHTKNYLIRLIDRMFRYKIITIMIFLLCFGAIVAGFTYSGFHKYTDDFLTDSSLILNTKMYKYMLMVQFRSYITDNVFLMAIFGVLIFFASYKNNAKRIGFAFISGTLCYWVLASKPMFFHNYYTLIIMITSSIFAGFMMFYIIYSMNSKITRALVTGLMVLIVFPSCVRESRKYISKRKDFSSAIEYINNNTNKDDKFMFEGPLGPLSIYTKRSLVRPYRLDQLKLKEDIRELGFAETMKKYQIKYLLTIYDNPKYIDYAFLFTDVSLRYPSSNRNYLISKQIGNETEENKEIYIELENIVRRYNIKNKFRFVKKYGDISFYTFAN